MRCGQCDYPLWEIDARQCPECGRGFHPSEFDFVPGSVRFCCPGCEQTYYGTDRRGHLVPPEFDCVTCGEHLHMDRMFLRPAEGLIERQTKQDHSPWHDRVHLGRYRALRRTFYRALFEPGRLARTMPSETKLGDALKYAVSISVLLSAGAVLVIAVISGVIFYSGTGVLLGSAPSAAIGFLVVTTALLVGQVLWACVAHVLLMITGPRAGGFARTVEAFLFGIGSNFLMIVPICGWYVFWIWPIVTSMILLKVRQDVAWWRAAVAALSVPTTIVLLLIVNIFLSVAFTANTSFSPPPVMTTPGVSVAPAGVMAGALGDYTERTGAAPVNALELLRANDVGIADFFGANSQTTPGDSAPFGVWLDQLQSATPERFTADLDAAASATPIDTIAHRVGDYVFVYHGIDLDAPPDPGLWILVQWREPGVQQLGAVETPVVVTAGGATITAWDPAPTVVNGAFTNTRFNQMLADQNTLRAAHGLPPLPHPKDVDALSPAVAPD